MNKNLVIGVIVVLIVIAGGWFVFKDKIMDSGNPNEAMMDNSGNMMESSSAPDAMMGSDPAMSTDSAMTMEGDAKVFTVKASNFKFDTSEIKVNQGDTVKINFVNEQGFHDFVIDEFGVKTKQANGPSEETVTFVADKAGTYNFYCSVGQHRSMGMEGNFIVE